MSKDIRVCHPSRKGLTLWVGMKTDREYPRPYITIKNSFYNKDEKKWISTDFYSEEDLALLPYLAHEALLACADLRNGNRPDVQPVAEPSHFDKPAESKKPTLEQDDIRF